MVKTAIEFEKDITELMVHRPKTVKSDLWKFIGNIVSMNRKLGRIEAYRRYRGQFAEPSMEQLLLIHELIDAIDLAQKQILIERLSK
jgi:hypothetical protein